MFTVPLSIPSPDWSGFTIGPFTIRAYALCLLAGIALAIWVTGFRLKRRGVDPGIAIDVAFWAVPLGIVVARLYHVVTHPGDYFYAGADLWEIVRIWDGGIAIFGSMIGGLLGIWIGTRIAHVRFFTFLDALAPGMLLAQAMGRLGNWFNHELFGLPTDLPWGLQIETSNAKFPHGLPSTTLFHPLFLYEMIWNIVGFALLLWVARRWKLQWGRVFALYCVWYGVGRFWLEGLRIDPTQFVLGVQINQLVAGILAVFGLVLFLVQAHRHPGGEPSPYRGDWRPPVQTGEEHVESGDSPTKDTEGDVATSDSVAVGEP